MLLGGGCGYGHNGPTGPVRGAADPLEPRDRVVEARLEQVGLPEPQAPDAELRNGL
jgi:hypothetical protein